jgi:chlorobactene glucosyltransferase
MAFRREAYDAIGGHAAVRASVVDDIDLARRVAGAGLAWRLLDATELVSCRMYRSGSEAAAGFAGTCSRRSASPSSPTRSCGAG